MLDKGYKMIEIIFFLKKTLCRRVVGGLKQKHKIIIKFHDIEIIYYI